MAERRRASVETRQPDMANMLKMLAFIDETSLRSNLIKTTGGAPVGARLIDHAPFGHALPGNDCQQTARQGTPGPSSRALAASG